MRNMFSLSGTDLLNNGRQKQVCLLRALPSTVCKKFYNLQEFVRTKTILVIEDDYAKPEKRITVKSCSELMHGIKKYGATGCIMHGIFNNERIDVYIDLELHSMSIMFDTVPTLGALLQRVENS